MGQMDQIARVRHIPIPRRASTVERESILVISHPDVLIPMLKVPRMWLKWSLCPEPLVWLVSSRTLKWKRMKTDLMKKGEVRYIH